MCPPLHAASIPGAPLPAQRLPNSNTSRCCYRRGENHRKSLTPSSSSSAEWQRPTLSHPLLFFIYLILMIPMNQGMSSSGVIPARPADTSLDGDTDSPPQKSKFIEMNGGKKKTTNQTNKQKTQQHKESPSFSEG